MAVNFVTVKLGGEKVVIGALESYELATEQRLRRVVEEHTRRVMLKAAAEAPVSSGKLVSSIDTLVREKDGWIRGWVKSKARYSLYQEYGTGIAGSISNTQERPEWHRYQQAALKERVYTKHGWALRTPRRRANRSLLVREEMGIHTPPPLSKLKSWAALHGVNPYALRLMIYRRQGINAHPFFYGADRAQESTFRAAAEEAIAT